MHALIEFLGKQFKVEDGSKIKVPYIDFFTFFFELIIFLLKYRLL